MHSWLDEKYSGIAQALHWLVALLVVTQFALVWTADTLPRGDLRTLLMLNHKSVGMTVLILALLRITWRLVRTPPAFPATMSLLEQWIARITHWLLYLLIFAMPLTGWLMSSSAGRDTQWFGLFTFPRVLDEHEARAEWLNGAHELLAWVLFGLALLHILATVWHMVVKKDGLIRRMLP